jgi:hypothetical protein
VAAANATVTGAIVGPENSEGPDRHRRSLAASARNGAIGHRVFEIRAITEDAMRDEAHPMAIRYSLGSLLAFGALNAIGGGYYGLSGLRACRRNGSRGVLSLIISFRASFSWSSWAARSSWPPSLCSQEPASLVLLALTAGLVVLGWLAAQVTIIGYVSWMQPATPMAGVLVLFWPGCSPSRLTGRSRQAACASRQSPWLPWRRPSPVGPSCRNAAPPAIFVPR